MLIPNESINLRPFKAKKCELSGEKTLNIRVERLETLRNIELMILFIGKKTQWLKINQTYHLNF